MYNNFTQWNCVESVYLYICMYMYVCVYIYVQHTEKKAMEKKIKE